MLSSQFFKMCTLLFNREMNMVINNYDITNSNHEQIKSIAVELLKGEKSHLSISDICEKAFISRKNGYYRYV